MINNNEALFGIKLTETKQPIDTFLKARMKQWFNGKDFRHDIIEAVVESEQTDLHQMFEIASILRQHAQTAEFKPTVESLTRVINLSEKLDASMAEVDPQLFENDAEKELFEAFNQIKLNAGKLSLNDNFEALKGLNPLIENYFENTMVMVDDEAIRNNRLRQLTEIAKMALSFASLDKLVVK